MEVKCGDSSLIKLCCAEEVVVKRKAVGTTGDKGMYVCRDVKTGRRRERERKAGI